MANGKFKIRNTDNLTTEQVKGYPCNYQINGERFIPIGISTHADENYIYGKFEHNGDDELLIVIDADCKCSMEIRGD